MKGFMRSTAAALVFVALLVYVFTAERGRVPHEDELFGLNVEQASRLQVTAPNLDLLIEKRDDTWHVEKPFKGLADQDEAEKRIKAITELKPSGTRSDLDLDDEKFGLKEPRLTAVLDYGEGKEIKLLIGKKTPVGSEAYAKIEGRKDLYILSASVFNALNLNPDKLREKKLAKIDSERTSSRPRRLSPNWRASRPKILSKSLRRMLTTASTSPLCWPKWWTKSATRPPSPSAQSPTSAPKPH